MDPQIKIQIQKCIENLGEYYAELLDNDEDVAEIEDEIRLFADSVVETAGIAITMDTSFDKLIRKYPAKENDFYRNELETLLDSGYSIAELRRMERDDRFLKYFSRRTPNIDLNVNVPEVDNDTIKYFFEKGYSITPVGNGVYNIRKNTVRRGRDSADFSSRFKTLRLD